MFRTRLISGIVLVILAFAVLWAGGWILAATLCAISLTGFFELTKATGVHTEGKKINGLEFAGFVLTVLYYAALFISIRVSGVNHTEVIYRVLSIGIVLSLLVFMFGYVFSFPKFKANQVMAAFFALVYAPVLISFLYMIRMGLEHGIYLVWLVFFASWGSDTCAYAVGVLFGKHKMTPKLSPKKSVEGAFGGVAGGAILFGLYTYFVINPFTSEQFQLNLPGAMCLGAVGALVSMVGDLAASAIKRDHDIKDYGKLIPGHGGIMDRFDSVIAAAPFVFLGIVLIAAN